MSEDQPEDSLAVDPQASVSEPRADQEPDRSEEWSHHRSGMLAPSENPEGPYEERLPPKQQAPEN
jgi:hypothetical protein